MTFSEEYLPDEGQEQDDLANYPTAFGITFTPQVSGIAFGLLGLLASVYLAAQWVMPAYNEYQKLKAEERSKQEQVEQAKAAIRLKNSALEAQLQEKEAQKSQVLALFASERNLDTILLDITQFIRSRNVKLTSFQPQGDLTVINDSSLGESVNNKLKRQSYNVEIKGQFEQTQAVIRDLERLQPLILLKNLNSQIQEGDKVAAKIIPVGTNKARLIPAGNQDVKTSFTMDVIIPLSPEEQAKLAPPPEPKPGESPK